MKSWETIALGGSVMAIVAIIVSKATNAGSAATAGNVAEATIPIAFVKHFQPVVKR
jgi:hypothetical protein